jgi:NDP-sugar pyrophosphorylase family protein
MNVLVLMAGPDEAFREAGLPYPKNLCEVGSVPLVQRVLERLRSLTGAGHRLVCCVKADEDREWHTGEVVRLLEPGAQVVTIPGKTGGAACTALLAIEALTPGEPLLVVNGDQIILQDLALAVRDFEQRGLDGGVVVFEAVHPRWSYVKVGPDGLVQEAAEKRPISKLATAGVYWFARAGDFVRCASEMIRKNAHTNGAFFICPAYNEMVLLGRRTGVYRIPREAYQSLADPQGLARYEELLWARGGVA